MNSLKKIGVTVMVIGAALALYNMYNNVSVYTNYAFYIVIIGMILTVLPTFLNKSK
ncbi:hypothetical protein [Flavobacterium psychraquaticum]|uniref:hypothetical protein n=1 Tax=Flavobacterium psychraquaticum TaxID=3103958 RepID=UPI002ACD948D|nr:hypothetical protein [Flavobacterium sp. LB-N7T]